MDAALMRCTSLGRLVRALPHRARQLTAVLALMIPLVACDDSADPPAPPLSDDEFISVMVELREAEWDAEDSDTAAAVFERSKAEILERHGTSEEEIQEFVRLVSRDLPRLTAVWDSISRLLRHERAITEPQ